MGFFNNWKLRTKLLVLVGFMVLVLVGLGLYNMLATAQVAGAGAYIFNENLRGVEYSLVAKSAFLNVSTAVYQHITSVTAQNLDEYENVIATKRRELDKALKDYETVAIEQRERELLKEIRSNLADYEKRIPKLLELSRAAKKEEARQLASQEMRQARLNALARLDELVKLNTSQAEAQNNKNDALAASVRTNSLVAITIVTLLSLLMGFWVAGLIVNPVRKVQEVAEALASGDLGKTARVKSRDEVGIMAAAVNRAVENLRSLVNRVAQTSEQVAASSEELAASSEEIGKVTQQVAGTIEQLAKGISEEAENAQKTSEVVKGMAANIDQASRSAQRMASDADRAVGQANSGKQAVIQAVAQMKVVRSASEQTSRAVQELGERSQKIGRIVEVITDIAGQTNLLALNAAIEAARAGEQGRGFAVVAEEVRKLAEQSRQAAEQISDLIRNIQGETQKVVEYMTAGSKEVTAGVMVVEEAGQAFEQIGGSVAEIVSQTREVAASAKELSVGSSQVVTAVGNIASITEESAAGAEEVSASAEEQNASVQEIAASAESLAELAQDLQAAVAAFRL